MTYEALQNERHCVQALYALRREVEGKVNNPGTFTHSAIVFSADGVKTYRATIEVTNTDAAMAKAIREATGGKR